MVVAARRLVWAVLLLAVGCKSPVINPGGAIACDAASQCPSNLPMCNPSSRICVGCISSFETCPAKMTCDQDTHTCIPADPNAPCTKRADCPRPGFDDPSAITCEVDAGKCVACINDNDCNAPQVCLLSVHQCDVPDLL